MAVLDLYADDLADLLDDGATVFKALSEVRALVEGMDITLEDVIAYFTEIYEASPEQYAENVKDDATWSETQTNSS